MTKGDVRISDTELVRNARRQFRKFEVAFIPIALRRTRAKTFGDERTSTTVSKCIDERIASPTLSQAMDTLRFRPVNVAVQEQPFETRIHIRAVKRLKLSSVHKASIVQIG